MNITVGFRFSVLHDGYCIGNNLKVVEVNECDKSVVLFSEMLFKNLDKRMKICDIENHIKSGEAKVLASESECFSFVNENVDFLCNGVL